MSNAKGITGIQRAPEYERDYYDVKHVESVNNEAKHGRKEDVNEPLIQAAVEAAHEVAGAMGQTVDIKYDTERRLVIMQVVTEGGKEVVRQVPPEELLRTAERLKENRSRYFDLTV